MLVELINEKPTLEIQYRGCNWVFLFKSGIKLVIIHSIIHQNGEFTGVCVVAGGSADPLDLNLNESDSTNLDSLSSLIVSTIQKLSDCKG